MTKKCKFEVSVDYNPDFFTETEISETIKKSIKDLDFEKKTKFGTKILCEPGKINSGVVASLKTVDPDITDSIDLVETLVSLSSCMDETEDDAKMILPEPKMEELMKEVRTAYKH
tara:strand:+ start:656 stop:1000 length:345 start_codon:yes stop_codon:yes gene_type:complete